jgi:uncharacterized protein YbbC (DUF1343 family)
MSVKTGLDRLLDRPGDLKGRKLGLIANPTTVTAGLVHGAIALKQARGLKLTTLFGPEHGIWADAQDLVHVEDSRDAATGLRVFSLYGKRLAPSAEMLADVDTLVYDVQDVGSRYYTFIYTMLHAMEACAAHGRRLVVLDRPNPVNGVDVDGNVLQPGWESFVGRHPLAVRHGMTTGELALMFKDERRIPVDLKVVPMKGWRRKMAFEDTGLPWVLPSPNMPTVDTAFVYPGACLVEGTNLSEGRGTTLPFQTVGAPFLDGPALARSMVEARLPGVMVRPQSFRPTFEKHAGQLCHGVVLHVTDPQLFRPVTTYLTLLHLARRQAPDAFEFLTRAYEFETTIPAFDLLTGSDAARKALLAGASVDELVSSVVPVGEDWYEQLRNIEALVAKAHA